MTLSKSAIAMLDYLTARSGGEISESDIRQATKISHGSFIAARKELVQREFIEYEKRGGNKPPIYTLLPTSMTAAKRVDRTDASPAQQEKSTPLMEEVQRMPRVIGEFSDFDEWTDALMNELGTCLDIEQSLVNENEYGVYSHQHCQRDTYRVTNEDGALTVS